MSNTCEPKSACPGCGRDFICGMETEQERCWCADLPSLKAPPEAREACYCPECLKKMLAAKTIRPV